jgi:hypothetical protein
MRLTDIVAPDTPAARGAPALAASTNRPLTAHALRSWFWAEAFARVDDIHDIDHELLYGPPCCTTSAPSPRSTTTRSPTSTREATSRSPSRGQGLGAWRQRVLDVIVRHNWPAVDPAMDAEGYLLEIATGLDISGARPDALPEDSDATSSPRYPRGARRRVRSLCRRSGRSEARHRRAPPGGRRHRRKARREPASNSSAEPSTPSHGVVAWEGRALTRTTPTLAPVRRSTGLRRTEKRHRSATPRHPPSPAAHRS